MVCGGKGNVGGKQCNLCFGGKKCRLCGGSGQLRREDGGTAADGGQCLETPDGTVVARAGERALVTAGPPMVLTGIGTDLRRSLALVLPEISEPWTSRVSVWCAKGLCAA